MRFIFWLHVDLDDDDDRVRSIQCDCERAGRQTNDDQRSHSEDRDNICICWHLDGGTVAGLESICARGKFNVMRNGFFVEELVGPFLHSGVLVLCVLFAVIPDYLLVLFHNFGK